MYKIILTFLLMTVFSFLRSQQLYFPPVNPSLGWDTVSPSSLGWCTDKIDTLYDFLEQENTKAFVVLKDGKIVLEKYFGTFVQDSLWYWASAGKTVTSFLVGKAQEEEYLSIQDKSSQYLGTGWTSCTTQMEDQITIWNELTMTSGLDDGVPDNHCTIDTCLVCIADAGTRWAYHNAPYTLLEKVIETSTGHSVNLYTQQKLMTNTGMSGFWFTSGYDNVFISNARSMARFGLLVQNHCIWDQIMLLSDTGYEWQMTHTSQQLNLGYGYLWWLNGKSSYMVPGSQVVIPGSYAPDAPADMFSGLGKNGQIVSIARSKGIVFVRMGNQPGSSSSEITTVFCNQIWQYLNQIMCGSNAVPENLSSPFRIWINPNPAKQKTEIHVEGAADHIVKTMCISDLYGRELLKTIFTGNNLTIDCSRFPPGVYICTIPGNGFTTSEKLILY
jgi:CubicO group peptidase (beta-lactamase class C family)